jgi:hypothetical protein
MRNVLIDIAIGLGLLAVLAMPWWLPRYRRWVDARMVRKVNARRAAMHAVKRDPFPHVHFEANDDHREERRWN